jgi:GT2 family glycosyltransferase
MKIGAFTLTFNRLDLTKRTHKSLADNSYIDYHLYIDQNSNDGTQEWIEKHINYYIFLKRNIGISKGISLAIETLKELDLDLIIKLDNDIEIVTPEILEKIKDFYSKSGMNYIISPRDLTIDPNYEPQRISREVIGDYTFQKTTHTGGAFLVMPKKAFIQLSLLKLKEDMDIVRFFRAAGYQTGYLMELGINHIGLNKSTSHESYIF